jgi:hypothetical protein
VISITTNNRGRAVKFTPERIDQIRNLVERGTSREEIAEIIGVTVGSLQVTCSRLGISLRRRPVENGVRLLPRPTTAAALPPPPAPVGNGIARPIALALVLLDGDRRRETPLRLPADVLNRLVLDAAFRGIPLADAMADALARSLKD